MDTDPIAIDLKWSINDGIFTSPELNESDALIAISFVPPPPGIRPTPASTRPMYASEAWIPASQCIETSSPPPITNPWVAETTGTLHVLILISIFWNPTRNFSISSKFFCIAIIPIFIRLAPTENCLSLLPITIPFQPSLSAISIASLIPLAIPSPIEFPFVWNSIHITPSPISCTVHSGFLRICSFSLNASSM